MLLLFHGRTLSLASVLTLLVKCFADCRLRSCSELNDVKKEIFTSTLITLTAACQARGSLHNRSKDG